MSEKKYIGWSAKAVDTKFGQILNLSIKVSDLQPNEKGYAAISVMQKKEPDQYGNTHYMVENDYKPKHEEPSHPF